VRAPTWPWDGADIGEHRFRYGLAVFEDACVVPPLAERFNHPLTLSAGAKGGGIDLSGLVALSHDGIAIEAIKRAEDNDALIVRLWERNGTRCDVRVTCAPEVTGAMVCDLLETPQDTVVLTQGTLTLGFAPFEIKTLRLDWTG